MVENAGGGVGVSYEDIIDGGMLGDAGVLLEKQLQASLQQQHEAGREELGDAGEPFARPVK